MRLLIPLRTAFALLTRVPVPLREPVPDVSRATPFFPLVGAFIGSAVGLVAWGAIEAGVPRLGAAALAMVTGILLTGALHEDGLADVADGFGGGYGRARKLEIMRDSRLGTYGTLALVLASLMKASAIAALNPARLLPVLVAAYAIPRAAMVVTTMWLPPARTDGMAASAGPTALRHAFAAMAIGIGIGAAFLSACDLAIAVSAALLGGGAIATVARWQIGGRTGDVIGAAEQAGEILILLVLAARHGA